MATNPYQVPNAALADPALSTDAPSGIVTTANVVYALHTLSIVIALAGAATVIGSFLFSIPSIIAVIINYVKRGEARGTWVESHFRWQIRTFWYAMLWVVLMVPIALLLAITIIGLPLVFAIPVILSAWLIYRVARGWLRLRDRKAMYV
jgi:uncharacterized membrane protein